MTVVANFSAIKYECCDKACAVTPSQCRCSTRVGYFLLALVVVPTEHYFVVISAGVVAFWCKYAETSACVSLTLLAQSCSYPLLHQRQLLLVAHVYCRLLALSIPYIVAGAVIKSAFVHTAVFGPIRFFRREKTGSD